MTAGHPILPAPPAAFASDPAAGPRGDTAPGANGPGGHGP